VPKNKKKSHTAKTRTMALDDKFAIAMRAINLRNRKNQKAGRVYINV
jgi:hypothetical protein